MKELGGLVLKILFVVAVLFTVVWLLNWLTGWKPPFWR